MTREILMQYAEAKKEIKDLQKKIEWLEERIPQLEKRISDIEHGETVKDKVTGGYGGVQSYVIEGVPTTEYTRKKMELHIKKELLKNRKELLKSSEMELLLQTNEVERYIKGINDSHIRRIVRFRVVDSLTWNEVAMRMGGGNTADGIKKVFYRFFGQNESRPLCPEEI